MVDAPMIIEMEQHFWEDIGLKTDLSASVMDRKHRNSAMR